MLSEEDRRALGEADDEVRQFLAVNSRDDALTKEAAVRDAVEAFVRRHSSSHPVAVVTAGGTVAPLERQEIRHITNLSTGQRGAASAEEFLKRGYAVIYFHKTGCLLPFARHFQDGGFLDRCRTVTDTAGDSHSDVSVTLPDELGVAAHEHGVYVRQKGLLLRIPLHTVVDYQLGLRTILNTVRTTHEALGQSNSRTLVYLVAAVSDFYVPYHELPAEKVDSRPDLPDMTIHLRKVPKALARGLVGNLWGEGAFVTTFKLETDIARIDEKVLRHVNGFGNIKLVVSNLQQSIRTKVRVHDTRDLDAPIELTLDPSDGRRATLEAKIVSAVTAKHAEFMATEKW